MLQIASRSAVWLVDLISLHGSRQLDQSLSRLMQNSAIIKLGCQLSGDMSKLHRSYPQMQAFQHASALLDIPGPWNVHQQLSSKKVSTFKTGSNLPCIHDHTEMMHPYDCMLHSMKHD